MPFMTSQRTVIHFLKAEASLRSKELTFLLSEEVISLNYYCYCYYG